MAASETNLRLRLAAGALALSLAVLLAGAARADDAAPLSPAQTALFESNHLGMIRQAERLDYRFEREASSSARGGGSYSDRVALDVRPRDGGGKDIWTDFLTAEHHVQFPPLMDFHGNPLVMYFLEHDAVEMHDQTGGAVTYFRNHIRRAFFDGAELRPVEIERGGKRVHATEITIRPFAGDTHLAQFQSLAEKRYRFVISEEVPGSLVEIAAEAPQMEEQPATRETMTFAGEEPCAGDSGPCVPAAAR